jgi:23S rRNA (uracil1939-C5)-methyltransferase
MSIEPETFQVSIQEFSSRGYGLAKVTRPERPPIDVEIAHTLPGDQVHIEMRRKMRPPRKGRLLNVIVPSETRVEPRCAHARVCGGCCWQQMDYAAQLKTKQALVSRLFNLPTKSIIPCDDPFAYRNKMEFSFSENRAGQKFLGLMIAQAEPYVFNVDHCHLCKPWFSDVLQATRLWWEASGVLAYHPARDVGTLRYLTLRESAHTGQKMAVLNIAGRSELSLEKFNQCLHLDFVRAVKEAVPNENISIFLRIHEANKGKPTEFREVHLAGPDHIIEELHLQGKKLSFKISPSSFFQPNTLQAEKLYMAALSHLAHLNQPIIYDLYCGTGTLGMIAASVASQVIGIELSPQAVQDARENAARNHIERISFYQGDVGKVLTQLMSQPTFKCPDAVIVDPPRAGLDPLALQHLKTLKPKAILYISCNPLTQSANIQELLDFGYSLLSLQPVDQFPHTYHIENIAYLER